MPNKIKGVLLNVQRASLGALRRGTARWNAAPQLSSPGPIQPVRSSRHAHSLDAKHAEALKPSILIFITPTLFQVFAWQTSLTVSPCPYQAHCPGYPVWCHVNIFMWIFTMNIQINIHENIYNEYLWWNRDIISPKRIFKKIFMFWEIFFWMCYCNLNIMNIY